MKYLLVVLVLAVAFWLWRKGRTTESSGQVSQMRHSDGAAQPDQAQNRPLAMIRCRHCGVHLPQSDAVQGQQGFYCGALHRASAEVSN
jgi:uncharacterized protein